jgi:O-antigen ligase
VGALLAGLLLLGGLVLPYVGGYPLAYVLIALTLVSTLWLVVANGRPSGGPATTLFLLAWLLMAIAFAVTARAPRDVSYVLNFAMFVFYAPLCGALARFGGRHNATVVALLCLAGAVIAFAVASYQSWDLRMPRATGFFSDPIWAAQAAIILGFLALVGVRLPGRWTHLFWLGPLLGTLAAFLGQSRGPLIAAPVLVLIGLVFAFRRWWLAVPVAAGVAAAAILLVGTLSPSSLLRIETLETIAEQVVYGETIGENSTGQRVAFYQSSWEAMVRQPWLGYGWERKLDAIIPYLADNGAMLAEGHHHLHSDWADFGVSAGILGLIAYAMVLAAPIAGAFASPRDGLYRRRLLGAWLLSGGYLCCGLTYLMLGYEFHTTLYVVLAAILLGFCRERPPAVDRESPG